MLIKGTGHAHIDGQIAIECGDFVNSEIEFSGKLTRIHQSLFDRCKLRLGPDANRDNLQLLSCTFGILYLTYPFSRSKVTFIGEVT